MALSSASLESSPKLDATNFPHHQGELVKEVVDGNSEESRMFSGPLPESEMVSASGQR